MGWRENAIEDVEPPALGPVMGGGQVRGRIQGEVPLKPRSGSISDTPASSTGPAACPGPRALLWLVEAFPDLPS